MVNGLVVAFDGSLSSDPDEDELGYLWNFGDEQTSTEVSPTHTYAQGGDYIVTLTVDAANAVAGVPLKLKDLSSGLFVDLTEITTYTYLSAASETRKFELSASSLGFPSGNSSLKSPAACLLSGVESKHLLKSLRQFGPSPVHRRSFSPVGSLLGARR